MTNPKSNLGTRQMTWLVILRVAIGWHFLYEGLVKVFNPAWSPFGYLMDSKGIMAPLFHAMASNPTVLKAVDHMNEWGLVLIGLGLVLGIFTRLSIYSGMLLLAFYYLSHPPFPGLNYALPSEGSYFIVDKVVIEFIALGVLSLFPTGRAIGLDRLLFRNK
ncbi:MAG: DoxX family membrane protein [Bacteroidota bacterium]